MGLRVFALHCHPRSSLLLHLCIKAKTLAEAKQVHAHMLLTGIHRIPSVETKLLNLYVKCGSLPDARLAFDNMTKGDVFPWNVMIGGYVKHGETREALELYHQMQKVSSTNPDNYTYSSVLNACARLASLSEGKLIYDEIISKGCEMDVIVENALINMFMKCGSIEDARRVFDKMCERNLVSWTAMVSGYAQGGFADEALRMFYEMQGEDVKANYVTVASVLPACAQLSDLQQGKEIHGYIIRRGLDLGIVVGNALIDMYAKCGSIGSAQKVFDKMLQRDVVSWNVAIAGYAQNGRFDECMELFRKMQCAGLKIDVITWNTLITAYAQNGYGDQTLELFQQMQLRGVKPNSITIASVLSACAAVSALQEGKRIHDLVNRSEFKSDICVGNALIDMYAKCRCLQDARCVFDNMSEKSVVTWTAMISGYVLNRQPCQARELFLQMKVGGIKPNVITWNVLIGGYMQNGHCNEALKSFQQMQLAGVKPTSVSVVGILSACAQLTTLQQGKEIHGYVVKCGFECNVFVGNTLIDMYTKCGNLEDAGKVFDNMHQRTAVSWTAMIAGYGMYGQAEKALTLFNQMLEEDMKPNDITFICVLSACSHAGLVKEGLQYFNVMNEEYHIAPSMKHYACIVDLLGRAGQLYEAEKIINTMPFEPNAIVWGTLLSACRIHCNTELAERVAECLLELQPGNAGNYVLLSNIYATAGRWGDAMKVRKLMDDRGLKKKPGFSWIEAKNSVIPFFVEDTTYSQMNEIYRIMDS